MTFGPGSKRRGSGITRCGDRPVQAEERLSGWRPEFDDDLVRDVGRGGDQLTRRGRDAEWCACFEWLGLVRLTRFDGQG
jgi:hypothetical protein